MFNIIFFVLLGLGVLFCFLRLLLGPTIVDRAVALDTFSTVTSSILVFLALFFKRGIYLDVALVYAILAFVGSIVIARYIEKGI
ncbi:cation:proton antiporter [bacterium]|nr:cation:proton antiporter [bacterium]